MSILRRDPPCPCGSGNAAKYCRCRKVKAGTTKNGRR